jgi:hypothetical protein
MTLRAFRILSVLSCVNLVLFGVCSTLAGQDTGASFAGLVPAMTAFASLFISFILTAVAWGKLLAEIRIKRISWQAIVSPVLAMLPLLVSLYFSINSRTK